MKDKNITLYYIVLFHNTFSVIKQIILLLILYLRNIYNVIKFMTKDKIFSDTILNWLQDKDEASRYISQLSNKICAIIVGIF